MHTLRCWFLPCQRASLEITVSRITPSHHIYILGLALNTGRNHKRAYTWQIFCYWSSLIILIIISFIIPSFFSSWCVRDAHWGTQPDIYDSGTWILLKLLCNISFKFNDQSNCNYPLMLNKGKGNIYCILMDTNKINTNSSLLPFNERKTCEFCIITYHHLAKRSMIIAISIH